MKKILFISFLVDHPEGEKYTNGLTWNTFRENTHKNAVSLDRLFHEKTDWDIYNIEELDSLFWNTLIIDNYSMIVLSGSPYSVNDNEIWIQNFEKQLPTLLKKNIPIIGLCFGHQLIAKALGGVVSKTKAYQGNAVLECLKKNEIYIAHTNHNEYVSMLPKDAKVLAKGPNEMPYVVEYAPHILGVQCHMEKNVECQFSEKYWKELVRKL